MKEMREQREEEQKRKEKLKHELQKMASHDRMSMISGLSELPMNTELPTPSTNIGDTETNTVRE